METPPEKLYDRSQVSSTPDDGEKSAQSNEIGTGDVVAPRQLHGWKWAVAYTSILSVTFLFALDNTIVAAIQPSILEAFGQVELLPWIGVAFALGSTAILPWGKAYGVFDIKWLLLANILLFEVGSAICGAAPNITALIIGRVIAGVGGCGMYSGGLSYIASLTTINERPVYTAGVAVIWGLGSVLGPVVGGAFATSNATWRWGFYINLVIGGAFAPAYFLLWPSLCLQPNKSLLSRLRMVDWVGTVFFIGGSVSFIMAITFGGSVYPWNSGSAIALWVVSGILLIVTIIIAIWHPLVTKEDRLIPAHFFTKPVLVNLGVQMFLVSGVMLAAVYYIPLYFAFTRGDGVLQAGVRLLPFVFLMVFAAILSGAFLPKTGYYIPWYIFGSILVLVGSALMVTVHADTSVARTYGFTILVGAGCGFYVVAGFAVTQALVPVHDVANAVGFQAIAQVLGSVVFLSVSGSIFYNSAVKFITPLLPVGTPPSFIADLIAGTSSSAFRSLSPDVAHGVVAGIADSLRNVWIFYLSAGSLSFVLTFFLGRDRLNIVA
ncbi:major facilitator superfamily transporter [Xylaria cf. heliscus]|nr:major facilitator superfamily transporter [Xylaria cf. heliscus]